MPKTKPSAKRTPKKPVIKSKPASRTGKRSLTSSPKPPSTATVRKESSKATGVSVPVLGTDGKPSGKMTLPGELFAAKVNKILLAQAVRVYLANQREGSAATKTRGQVEGSTRKIYRQKGTGRARHGAIRAPIFVGGGIVFGPTPRDYHLDLPKKMKRAALASALTSVLGEGRIVVMSGLSDMEPKTKHIANALRQVGVTGSTLLVVAKDQPGVVRAARNIEGVDIMPVQNLHTYSVLSHQKVIFMKEAIVSLRGVPDEAISKDRFAVGTVSR